MVCCVLRNWPALRYWTDEAVYELNVSSHTEDYGYNQIISGLAADSRLLWFVLAVSRPANCIESDTAVG